MEYIYQYGLFFAKTITFVVAFAFLFGIVASSAKPKSRKGKLEITDLSEKITELKQDFLQHTLDKKQFKAQQKAQKKQQKQDKEPKGKLYVVDFKGSMDAHEVDTLREEITAIVSLANPAEDKVLVRLESGGGVVHGYGLGASQLKRLRDAKIPLTVSIDKVAASGGYMMACVADEILAAPFAIVGSIGVIAQLPNFNKILKKNDVEFEQITAGEFKRTLTIFGENTDKGREKFRDEIEQTHQLFKHFVSENRSELDIDNVATGEHWFGLDALKKGLVDRITTSDDELLQEAKTRHLYQVKYRRKKLLSDKFAVGVSHAVERAGVSLLSKVKALKP